MVISSQDVLKRLFPEDALTRPIAAVVRQARLGREDGKPYHGELDCSDCMTMSHCETHYKDEGTYPIG